MNEKNIHEENGFFYVGVFNRESNQYERPADTHELKQGWNGVFSKRINGLGAHATDAEARRYARKLFGYSKSTD